MSPSADFAHATDPYRRELLVHCYRMLGSFHDAEDAVQDAYLRAWKAFDRFEERASVRTWLYRITTRVCLTALDGSVRRVLPSGLGAASDDPAGHLGSRRGDVPWLEPFPDHADDGDHAGSAQDPATIAGRRESTRLAFVAALQELVPRQRAALLLCDVLAWSAAETAELLEISVPAVNSALQRARAHLARDPRTEETVAERRNVEEQVLDRFVSAFERADVAALAELLRADVVLEMPPVPTWFAGRDDVAAFFERRLLPSQRRHLVPVRANGCPAAATYAQSADGVLRAHSIQVLETVGDRIAGIFAFLDPDLFALFGLPDIWPEVAVG